MPPKPALEPHYVPAEEAETTGMWPVVVEGKPFERSTGTIKVKDETLILPPELRQTAHVLVQNLSGDIVAIPATSSDRGGGLVTVDAIDPLTEPTKVYKKSSHKTQI